MYIYNVTTFVHWGIHESWVKWMQEKRIPAVIATGCFDRAQFVKLLDTDETEGLTYAVQYFCGAKDDYLRYVDVHDAAFKQEGHERWGEYCIAFSSLMELVK
ncbi:DUF4286 family protein [Paraflavitalea pollutisoli]|uniref:DUF4286 family protein n=1 Tax=Paraflavitalea pollutisoli TaxID=3034143 RepID=UPI0023EBB170|nr:DUF4286 family protein [Paraflavitalea sp. H1-2-19X]